MRKNAAGPSELGGEIVSRDTLVVFDDNDKE